MREMGVSGSGIHDEARSVARRKCPHNISFLSKGAPVFVEGGGRLFHGTMAQWPVQACKQYSC